MRALHPLLLSPLLAACSGLVAEPVTTYNNPTPTSDCTGAGSTDEPDPDGLDVNCDGVDGDAARALFVSPNGNDGAAGTREAPLASVSAALDKAASGTATQILVQVGTYTEPAPLDLVDGVGIHGGYGADWTRTTQARTLIEGPAVAARASGLQLPTAISRLELLAADGLVPSGSSVGLLVIDTDQLHLYDGVRIASGDGAAGENGVRGAQGTGATPGTNGGTGTADNQSSPGAGGNRGVNAGCPAANGGAGGQGGQDPSFSGQSGSPAAGGARGGSGSSTSSCSPANGGPGDPGQGGSVGNHGPGGSAEVALDASGYVPVDGLDGQDGTDGTGGGGGGGSSGQTGFACIDGAGNGGGGGGAGGCGGEGGEGGTGGGGTFALVLSGSDVQLDGVVLATGDGGDGGDGGAGGPGGQGTDGRAGGAGATSEIGRGGDGGNGGDGGDGGAGGGGAGGPAVGIWTDGTPPDLDGTTFEVGQGGTGGASAGNPGGNGGRAEVIQG